MNTIKQYSEDKDPRRNNNHHISNMATLLKNGKNDWLHTKDQVEELAEILGNHHILIARRYNGMYNVHIASFVELVEEASGWAIANRLDLKDSRSLKKFIEETKILWT